ncbi:MAG: hypothetical protein QM804_10285 [Propionicimonas sp.]
MIERIRLAVAACILTALRVEGIDPDLDTVEVAFVPPAAVTMAERFDALTKGTASGISLETLQKDVLGWSADQIAEDQRNRTRAAARAALTAPRTATAPQADGGAAGVSEADEIKRKADAMGVLIRAGVDPDDAASRVGLAGVSFRPGLMPASLVARDGA